MNLSKKHLLIGAGLLALYLFSKRKPTPQSTEDIYSTRRMVGSGENFRNM